MRVPRVSPTIGLCPTGSECGGASGSLSAGSGYVAMNDLGANGNSLSRRGHNTNRVAKYRVEDLMRSKLDSCESISS
jgi:hypothetical protein